MAFPTRMALIPRLEPTVGMAWTAKCVNPNDPWPRGHATFSSWDLQLYEVLAASVPVGPALKETPGRSAQARGSWHRAMLFEGRRGKANA